MVGLSGFIIVTAKNIADSSVMGNMAGNRKL
jgi:hypothetical protein